MIEQGAGCAQSIRAHLRDGIEAALRADPEVLANCKPRTGLGSFVRGLVLEACKGRVTAMKMLMGFLAWNEPAGEAFQLLQGIFFEPAWDWSASGVWLTLPQTEAESRADRPSNSLSQGISQGILEKVGGARGQRQTPPPSRAIALDTSPTRGPLAGEETVEAISLRQGISQGILKKPDGRIDGVRLPRPKAAAKEAAVGRECATAAETEPLNRRHRRKLAWMMRQAEKEDARIGHIAHTTMRSAKFAQAGAVG